MPRTYCFGRIEVRPDERRVVDSGAAVALGARAFDLLLALIEHRDRVIGKDELIALVWPDTVVEESNLTVQVSALRKVLGAESISTVPGRGYRFALAPDAPRQAAHASIGNGAIAPALPDKPSIAVLPFANLGADPEQEFFTDGITDDIIADLSRFHSLFVIARNSSFTYKGKAVDVRTVGSELGVRYVLEGSIRRSANRVRVNAQLIDAVDGKSVWAEKYDRVLEDIFAVQEEIALAIEPDNVIALVAIAYCEFQQLYLWIAPDRDRVWHNATEATARAIASDPSASLAYSWRGLLQLYSAPPVRWDEACRTCVEAWN
ncbi:MAG: winged helix-turn-helix domain-containing protein [Burkholderiaceae bacterium]|nr:winged helix-turn-helix domain-containing protein [Burkholderiaceae bacterium]